MNRRNILSSFPLLGLFGFAGQAEAAPTQKAILGEWPNLDRIRAIVDEYKRDGLWPEGLEIKGLRLLQVEARPDRSTASLATYSPWGLAQTNMSLVFTIDLDPDRVHEYLASHQEMGSTRLLEETQRGLERSLRQHAESGYLKGYTEQLREFRREYPAVPIKSSDVTDPWYAKSKHKITDFAF